LFWDLPEKTPSADRNEWPEMILGKDLTWDRVTSLIEDACREYIHKNQGD